MWERVVFIANLAYEASAGSGKTFMLVGRYLSLLFLGKNPSKIVALTFTNKAANEMRERITQTLRELETRDELDVISSLSSLSKEQILAKKDEVFERFLHSNPKILTIDSFFTQILRKFSLYASLMPDFTMQNSLDNTKLYNRFLKKLRTQKKLDALVWLSLESNKRFDDIFEVLEQFYEKSMQMQELSFTKQNIEPSKSRAVEIMSELKTIVFNCDEASTSTKNGVSFESFDDILGKAWLQRDSFDYKTFAKCYNPKMDELLAELKEQLRDCFNAKEANFFANIFELVDIYKQSKKELYMQDAKLSFNDLTYLVYTILNSIDDRDFLYFRLDAKIEHMLLDEFQDTSIAQYKVLKPLIDEIVSGVGVSDEKTFFFVGDTKQAIYRFRGGFSALFGYVLAEQNSKLLKLSTNYRSKKNIVEFVNSIFESKIELYTPQHTSKDGGFVSVQQSQNVLDDMLLCVEELLAFGFRDIAVLCVNNDDGANVKLKLQESGKSVINETNLKLINQKRVKAIYEYIKYQYFKEDLYKENFFALIAKQSGELKSVDFFKKTLFEIVKNVIDEYGLGDLNTLEFLNEVARFADVEEFIFEFESIEKLVTSSGGDGIRVLTIHKSKGLEYDAVIVLDRLKGENNRGDSIIYDYDGLSLNGLYLRQSARDYVDENYADILQKEKILAEKDTINAQYVALTRAKEALFVIKKESKSYFDTIDLEIGSYGVLEQKEIIDEPLFEQNESLEYKKEFYGLQKVELKKSDEGDENFAKINFGVALHYMLESLAIFSYEAIDDAKAMMQNRYAHLLSNSELKDLLKRVTMLLANGEFLEIVRGEIFKEKLIYADGEVKIIDLLIKKGDDYIVLDYKSSELFAHKHIEQVAKYMSILRGFGLNVKSGYICYLLEDEVKIFKLNET